MAEDSCRGVRGCRRRWMAPATAQQPRAKNTFKLRRALVLHRFACMRAGALRPASWHSGIRVWGVGLGGHELRW